MHFFISDLHLSPDRPEITQGFETFLKTQAKNAEKLTILGDFFEVWLGDDDDTPCYQSTLRHLQNTITQGVDVSFMQGNRDFLLSEAFVTGLGATLLPDPSVIELTGEPTLLMHGDSLCTLDQEYMQFRHLVRSPSWQQEVLAKPLAERKALAQKIRAESRSMNSLKAEDIMDVTPAEVEAVMSTHHSRRLIHGHTHRPARHALTIENQKAERIVLGDWDELGWYLVADGDQLELHSFPIP